MLTATMKSALFYVLSVQKLIIVMPQDDGAQGKHDHRGPWSLR